MSTLEKIYDQDLERFAFIKEVHLTPFYLVIDFGDIPIQSTSGATYCMHGVFIQIDDNLNIAIGRYRVTPEDLVTNFFHPHCDSDIDAYSIRPFDFFERDDSDDEDHTFCWGDFLQPLREAHDRLYYHGEFLPLLLTIYDFLSKEYDASTLNGIDNVRGVAYQFSDEFSAEDLHPLHLRELARAGVVTINTGHQQERVLTIDFSRIPDHIKSHPRYQGYF